MAGGGTGGGFVAGGGGGVVDGGVVEGGAVTGWGVALVCPSSRRAIRDWTWARRAWNPSSSVRKTASAAALEARRTSGRRTATKRSVRRRVRSFWACFV